MAVRNPHWYSANGTRDYPLDDTATAVSDTGDLLPQNIITDINLRYPETLGPYPFLASVSVTANLVSLTIQAAASLTGDPGLAPVAVFSILQEDLIEGRPYALEQFVPGVGGWVVFGGGVQESFSGRFSGPKQALLAPRAAKQYRPLPVQDLGKLGHVSALTGVVQLFGQDPVQVVKESRDVDDVERDVIVVRLVATDGLETDGQEINVFEEFTGPCGARPESANCGEPAPIEFINTVPPDCDGNITLRLLGCAEIAEVVPGCGVVVDCQLGLIDACLPDRLPDEDGVLPNEYPDLCVSLSEFSEDPPPDVIIESLSLPGNISESLLDLGTLPFIECFVPGTFSNGWGLVEGGFAFFDDNSPDVIDFCSISEPGTAFRSQSISQRNLTIWNGYDDSALNRRVTADVKLELGNPGAQQNAGIVLNYRPHDIIPSRPVYFLVQLDYDAQTFRITRFNGTGFVPEPAFVQLDGIGLDKWFRITAEVVPGTGDNVSITATLESLEDASIMVTLGPFITSNYLPASGVHGLLADRAISRFSVFAIEEI
jgi:hypothetical protein